MAQQKFSNRFRQALWETFGKKCFHCSRELLLVDMRVDHIIPEYLDGDSNKREAVLAEIGLPEDFDIKGHGNLAPSCDRCNGQKSASVLVGSAAAIAVTRIRERLPLLEMKLQKMRGDRDLEDVLRIVKRSIEGGRFTREEFLLQARRYTREEDDEALTFNFPSGTILGMATEPLVFSPHASEAMEERHLMPGDIADAVREGVSNGTATVTLNHAMYSIVGADDLKIVFTITGGTVFVLSAFQVGE